MRIFRYTGFDQSAEGALPEWVGDLQVQPNVQAERRPALYATLGTVYNNRTDILSAILEGLREEPINLILTVGRNRDPLEFGEQPAHVHIERYISQNMLLPRCDLVITHGGSGTMLDALSLGLPMVINPIFADQPINAQLCAELGVARAGPGDSQRHARGVGKPSLPSECAPITQRNRGTARAGISGGTAGDS
jgi:UDP:flavonoid glycosyltransferase YjiC (YdhE family)